MLLSRVDKIVQWGRSQGRDIPVFSERHVHVRYMLCRPSVCRLSVTVVHSTQTVSVFANFSTPFGIAWPFNDIRGKFYGARPGEPLRRGS